MCTELPEFIESIAYKGDEFINNKYMSILEKKLQNLNEEEVQQLVEDTCKIIVEILKKEQLSSRMKV